MEVAISVSFETGNDLVLSLALSTRALDGCEGWYTKLASSREVTMEPIILRLGTYY